ncbi:hypothetical protein HanIR_Chr11g0514381 [Helianthus annuus]|nr:hypothetical protein HanIR_Chr11g0514381 [Helianthus annuus]
MSTVQTGLYRVVQLGCLVNYIFCTLSNVCIKYEYEKHHQANNSTVLYTKKERAEGLFQFRTWIHNKYTFIGHYFMMKMNH